LPEWPLLRQPRRGHVLRGVLRLPQGLRRDGGLGLGPLSRGPFSCYNGLMDTNTAKREMITRAIAEGRATYLPAGARDNATARILVDGVRSEEHTSELQSRERLVCRRLLEQKNERRPGA